MRAPDRVPAFYNWTDATARFIKTQRCLGGWVVGNRVQIKHFHIVRDGLKTMREAFRYQHGVPIIGGQGLCMPLQKGWGVGAQVNGYVPNFSTNAAHQFHLGVWWHLVVHAANAAAQGGAGVVDLGDGFVPARSG